MSVELDFNIFQRYLIPSESCFVRLFMQKAGAYGNHKNPLISHFISVAFATSAVVMSFFNVFSYFLQAPFKIVLAVVQCDPLGAVKGMVADYTNVIRSFVFVVLGIYLIGTGIFFPKTIFTHFAPDFSDTWEVRLQKENTFLNGEIDLKNKEIQQLYQLVNDLKAKNLKLQDRLKSAEISFPESSYSYFDLEKE